MKILKRVTAALLALVMVVTMLPLSALATETESVTIPEETAPVGDGVLDVPLTDETETVETVPETAPATEPAEPTPEATVPEETWEIGDIEVEETAETVAAGEVVASGDCGENVTWMLSGDGVLTISGEGPMDDYQNSSARKAPWDEYESSITEVVIERGATSIGDCAFSSCKNLVSVTIPDGITSIGTYAFSVCSSLQNVVIPNSVTDIEKAAFINCKKLKDITIPSGVSVISDLAFRASALENVIISEGVTSIGSEAFAYCFYLKTITIPASITAIDDAAFTACSRLSHVYYGGTQEQWEDISVKENNEYLTSANIYFETGALPDELLPPKETEPEEIGDSLGENMNWSLADGVLTISGVGKMMSYGHYNPPWNKMKEEINSVIIGDGITNIGDCAFSGCVNLTSVTIPYSVTDIGYQAFKGCTSLPGVTIPNSVATIGQYAFAGCKSMTSIVIPEGVTRIEYGLLSGCKSLTSATLPDGITEILNYAFEGCEALPAITVPDSVISIGQGAFSGCRGLVDVLLPDSLCYIGKAAFSYCQNLPGIMIPDSVEQIGENAFDSCKNLVSITIPGRVTEIASSTFAYCESLHSVTIPDSVTTIQYHAFIICKNLKDVYYGGSKEQWENIEFTYYMNDHGNKNLLNANIHYNESAVLNDYYRLKVTPEETTYTVFSGRKLELTFSLTCNDFQVKEWDHPIVSFRELDVLENKGWEQVGNNWVLTLSAEKPGREFMTVTDIKSGRYLKMWVEVLPAPIQSYIDNSEIRINGSGSAYAYYYGDPNTTYHYSLNGEKDTVMSNDKGIIRIMLGTYLSGDTYENTVTFTQAGNKVLSPAIGFKSTVIAEKLAYTYVAESSFDVSVGKLTPVSVSFGVGLGVGTTIRKDYANDTCTMEMYDKAALDAYGKFELDTPDEFAVANIKFANISAQLKATGMGIYGHRYQNYQGSTDNMKAFATFLLGEALQEKPNFVALQEFQQWLAKKLYTQTSMDKIRGSGASISGGWGFGIGNFEINDVQLISGLKEEVEFSAAIAEKSYSSGGNEYSTAYSTSADLDLASVNVIGGALGADFLSRDNSVTVRKENGKKTLEGVTIGSGDIGVANILMGGRATTNYKHYVFEEDTLEELMEKSETITSYVNGDRIALSNTDIEMLAETISDSKIPVEYMESEKTNRLGNLDLEFGSPLIGWEFGAELCTMESVEYQTAGGYAVKDEILITSESGDYSAVVENELISLREAIDNAILSLIEEANAFFTKVGDTVQKGAETVWGWIDGAADSISDWFVSLTCASSEDVWGISYEIDIKSDQVNFALARQVSNSSEAYATRSAATIGRPFIVNVTDGTSGEQIKDFSTEPLTFTICYAGEDLMAANYNAETQVISMYRYSDDGDYFEYIGGIHDAEEKTVTATITKPGQYILAAEVMEEEEPGEDTHEYQLGDVNHDTKINAKDATLILQKSVGVLKDTAKFCETCAEVSGDGKLNAKDSTLILQFSVGLRQDFPAQK